MLDAVRAASPVLGRCEQRYTLTVQNNEGTRPLAAYSKALTAAGLVIETIREPTKDHAGRPTAPFFDLLARRQLLPSVGP